MSNPCDKLEKLQNELDEINSYIYSINKLKESKLNPIQELATLDQIKDKLIAKKVQLEEDCINTYDSWMDEADYIAKTYKYVDSLIY